MYVCLYVCMHVCMYACMFVYIYAWLFICVCMQETFAILVCRTNICIGEETCIEYAGALICLSLMYPTCYRFYKNDMNSYEQLSIANGLILCFKISLVSSSTGQSSTHIPITTSNYGVRVIVVIRSLATSTILAVTQSGSVS